MKKLRMFSILAILMVALILLLSSAALAGTKPITFGWQQNTADMPNLAGWNLLYSFTAGGPYIQLANVPYIGTVQNEYTQLTPVAVVADGQKRTVYFVANAVGKSGQVSGYSNEVNVVIDFTVVTIPIQLRIIIGN